MLRSAPRVFSYRRPARDCTLYAMLARVRSAAVLGIDAYLVEVETDIATVGLPQGAELSVRFVAQQPFKTQIVKLRLECPHVCRNVCRSVPADGVGWGR